MTPVPSGTGTVNKIKPRTDCKRILVTGGAGFVVRQGCACFAHYSSCCCCLCMKCKMPRGTTPLLLFCLLACRALTSVTSL